MNNNNIELKYWIHNRESKRFKTTNVLHIIQYMKH